MNGRIASRHRFHGLDAIRGVAAILVATRHISFLAPDIFPESFLAVDLFFVLSGVVLCDAYVERLRDGLSWRSFMGLRVIRLYPLYLVGSAFGLAAMFVDPAASPWPAPVLAALASVLLPIMGPDLYPLDCPAWSLFLEMIANLVFGLFAKVGTPTQLVAIIMACGLGLVALCIAQPDHSLDVGWTLRSLPSGLVRVGFSFAMGVLLRHLLERTPAASAGSTVQTMAVCAILLAVVAILVARPTGAARPFLELGAILVAFPALVFAMLRWEPSGIARRLSAGLGALSYPLYILHAPMAQLTDLAIRRADFGPQAFPGIGLAFMAMLIGGCWWIERGFDRPVRRRLMALRERFVTYDTPLSSHAL